jgi:WD40 repeat protein/outer membrane protein OmpA-like peptidoglycan-associated protein
MPTVLYTQTLTVFDENLADFPLVRLRFYALDSVGRPLLGVRAAQFRITENGQERSIVDFTMPVPRAQRALSAVLAVDVSGSMGEGNRIALARAAASTWVEAMNLEDSECALTSFDDKSYLNRDFTRDRSRLHGAISRLQPMEGTSYERGFLGAPGGALHVARRGRYKRVVVFLTDGLGGGSERSIIEAAQRDSITVYCIALGMAAPPILRRIAEQTSGSWYEHVATQEELDKIYRAILHQAQETPVGEIAWQSDVSCTVDRDVLVSLRADERIVVDRVSYSLPSALQARLVAVPRSVRFRDIPPGSSQGAAITLTAARRPITILGIESSNSAFVVGSMELPVTLAVGEKISLKVGFSPKDSSRQLGRVMIRTDACIPTMIVLTGGYLGVSNTPTLALRSPNGGERLYAGSDTTIIWDGLMPSEAVRLEYELLGEQPPPKPKITPVSSSTSSQQSSQQYAPVFSSSASSFPGTFPPDDDLFQQRQPSRTSRSSQRTATVQQPSTLSKNRMSSSAQATGAQTAGIASDAASAWQPWREITPAATNFLHRWTVPALRTHDTALINAERREALVRLRAEQTIDPLSLPEYPSLTLEGHVGSIMALDVSSDGEKIVTASADGTARIWDAHTGFTIAELNHNVQTGKRTQVISAAFNPAGTRIITTASDNTLRLWDAESGRLLKAVIPTSTELTNAGAATFADMLRGRTGVQVQRQLLGAVFSRNGKAVYTILDGGTIIVWNAETLLSTQGMFSTFGQVFTALAASPNGTHLAASSGEVIELWNLNTASSTIGRMGQESPIGAVPTFFGHNGIVMDVDFDRSGKRLVSASTDRTARVWDVASQKTLFVLRGHTNAVQAAQFSPDGQRIVTASLDGTIRLWRADNGKHIATLLSPVLSQMSQNDTNLAKALQGISAGALNTVAFSPDASRIIAGGIGANAFVWDIGGGFPQSDTTDAPFTIVMPRAALRDSLRLAPTEVGTESDSTIRNVLSNLEADPYARVRVQSIRLLDLPPRALAVLDSLKSLASSAHQAVGKRHTVPQATLRTIAAAHAAMLSESSEFSLVSGMPPFSVAAGTSATIEMRFAPRTSGERSALMEVVTFTDTLYALVRGTGSRRQLEHQTTLVAFPPTKVQSIRDTIITLVRNTAAEPVVLLSCRMIGPDTTQCIVQNPPALPLTLQSGQALTLALRFAPSVVGTVNGGIVLSVQGVTKPLVTQWMGEGTAPRLTAHLGVLLASGISSATSERNKLSSSSSAGAGTAVNSKTSSTREAVSASLVPHVRDAMRDTLRLTALQTRTARPLLNYVFFDEQSAVIPLRYKQYMRRVTDDSTTLQSAKSYGGSTGAYSDALEVYHNVLNILGEYLYRHPQVAVKLIGCNSDEGKEKGNLELSRKRAEAIRTYWRDVWSIEEKRVKIQARNKPERPSNALTTDGIEENRRVEIVFDSPVSALAALAPMVTSEPVLLAEPESIILVPSLESDGGSIGSVTWRVDALYRGSSLARFSGVGLPPQRLTWSMSEANLWRVLPDSLRDVLMCKLTARDSLGQAAEATLTAPFVFTREQPVMPIGNKQEASGVHAERFALMFFDFDKTSLNSQNTRLVAMIKTRLQRGSRVLITGYTDRAGDAAYNQKLSEDRAKTVATALGTVVTRDTVRGSGENTTYFNNALPEGRFYSRMVEVVIIQPHSMPQN